MRIRFNWLETELVLLIILVAGIYFPRLSAAPCSLDEPLWGTVAQEMIWSGNWIVPKQHGSVFPDRPPAHCWLVALSIWTTGIHDASAPRIPSAFACLFTSLLIYNFARSFLMRTGALAASVSYATMWDVLAKGRTADSDAVFSFFVAASLLFWIWGYSKKWHPLIVWSLGYSFAAFAGLTKGLQGPCFFAASVVVFLLLRRDWPFLFSRFHLAGVALFTLLTGAWLIPYWLATDWPSVKATFSNIVAERFDHGTILAVLQHLLIFPLDVFAMMLPWSLLLLLFAVGDLRKSITFSCVPITFLLVSIAVCFVPLWLVPGSHGRYFLPLFPCCAILTGMIAEKLICQSSPRMRQIRANLLLLAGALAVVVTSAVFIVSAWNSESRIAQSMNFASFYLGSGILLSGILFRAWKDPAGIFPSLGLLAIAAFVGLSFTGLLTNSEERYKVDIARQIEVAKETLPPDVDLVTLGYLHPVFSYYFAKPIRMNPWPNRLDDIAGDLDFFCYSIDQHPEAKLPFPWKKLAVVRCDRGWLTPSTRSVVIGRRLHRAD